VKRSDIKAGEAYYYDPQKQWQQPRYGEGKKAVVVDDKRYSFRTYSSYGKPPYFESAKGVAVLVDVYTEVPGQEEPRKERKAVPTAHLRGPWESTRAQVEAWREEERNRRQVADNRREQQIAEARRIAERAVVAGVQGELTNVNSFSGGTPYFRLSVAEMSRILDLLDGGEGR
jgi:hypothetical protein